MQSRWGIPHLTPTDDSGGSQLGLNPSSWRGVNMWESYMLKRREEELSDYLVSAVP